MLYSFVCLLYVVCVYTIQGAICLDVRSDWLYGGTLPEYPTGYSPTGHATFGVHTAGDDYCPGEGSLGPRWTSACGQSCASTRCSNAGGTWVPNDCSWNPYACEIHWPFSGISTRLSADACERACAANSACGCFVWDQREFTTTCWQKAESDCVGTGSAQPDVISGRDCSSGEEMNVFALCLCVCVCARSRAHVCVSASLFILCLLSLCG